MLNIYGYTIAHIFVVFSYQSYMAIMLITNVSPRRPELRGHSSLYIHKLSLSLTLILLRAHTPSLSFSLLCKDTRLEGLYVSEHHGTLECITGVNIAEKYN